MADTCAQSRVNRYRLLLKESGSRRQVLLIKAAYFVLQQFDLVISIMAPSLGLMEINPLMKSLLQTPLPLLAFKLGIPFLIAWLVPSKLLIPAILLLTVVIGWNLKELLFLVV